MSESEKGRASVGLTPKWEQQSLGERLQLQMPDNAYRETVSTTGRMLTSANFAHGDVILSSQGNPFMALGLSAKGYLPLTVVDTCGNQFNPKSIIQLIERHVRVVVFGTLRKTTWKSSYFDLWFQMAWEEAKQYDNWATYSVLWKPEANEFLTPAFRERLEAVYEAPTMEQYLAQTEDEA